MSCSIIAKSSVDKFQWATAFIAMRRYDHLCLRPRSILACKRSRRAQASCNTGLVLNLCWLQIHRKMLHDQRNLSFNVEWKVDCLAVGCSERQTHGNFKRLLKGLSS